MGRSVRVYPPFTPLRVEGKKVFAVLREHEMNDLGLWDQVTAKGKPILASPMRFRVVYEGQEAQVKPAPLRFTQTDEHKVLAESDFRAGPLSARVRSTWDYDGMMLMELTLLPADGQPVDSLTLEVPLRDDAAPLIHARCCFG